MVDRNKTFITVRTDGDDTPTKYEFGEDDKDLLKLLKPLFNVNRVQVTWKMDGATRKLVTIKRVQVKNTGVVTGTVLFVHDAFWLELKPNNGPPDGFAAGFPAEKFKDVYDKLKVLQKGDVVTIRYLSDFERHRIQSMQVSPPSKK